MNKHKFLIIALIVFLAALFIEKRQSHISKSDINIKKFEDVLYAKEKNLKNIVDSLTNFLDEKENFNFQSQFIFNDKQLKSIEDEGFTFLVYSNDTLKYWTDNFFDVPEVFSADIFNSACNKIGSFWVDITTSYVDNYKIIGLYRIKAEYKIQNKFLLNSFQKDLSLPDNISISLIPLSYGIDVKNSSGDYLLSLIPNSKITTDYKYSDLVNILYLLALLILLIYIQSILLTFYSQKNTKKKVLTILGIVFIVRVFMLIFNFPLNIYSQNLFDSQYFFGVIFSKSLGDLFLNLICLLLIVSHLFKLLEQKEIKFETIKPIYRDIISVSTIIFSAIIFFLGINFIKNFIFNSNFAFDIFNLLNLSIYSFIGLINIALVSGCIVFLIFKAIKFNLKFLALNKVLINTSIGIVIAFLILIIFIPKIGVVSFVSIFVLAFASIFSINKKYTQSIYFYGIFVFISALTITFVFTSTLKIKQEEKNKLLAVELTNERDDIAELLLKDVNQKLNTDQTIADYAMNPTLPDLTNDVKEYLKRRYFKSYWNKYDVNVDFCDESINNKAPFYCNMIYSDLITKSGTWVFENVVFISLSNGHTFYILIQPYKSNRGDTSVFYISLVPRLYPSNIGYPELLLDESINSGKIPDYSNAKYENDKLVSKSGTYNYPENGKKLFSTDTEFKILKENSLYHLVYRLSKGNFIVFTYDKITILQSIITFSYIFLIFVFILIFALFVANLDKIVKIKYLNFRTKLIISMLILLTLSFSLVGTITVLLNISQFKNKHKLEIIEKVQEINISLTQKYKDQSDFSNIQPELLSSELRDLSEVFGTDINLYNSNGFLIATSRPEIYNLEIIGKRISSFAEYNINQNTLVQFILDENISKLEYNSAYAQVNEDNENKAIVNMPYFIKPDLIRLEISNLLVSIINIYVVLFVIALIFSVLTAEQIISPLIILQNKFKKLELGKTHEKIEYKRKDEIGQLVSEYNDMVDKLQESIDKLSKSERESAWRDMAKQIAHEIKNPLTPMKLSVQLLMRSWENQDNDFDQRIKDVSNTLVTQIEALRRIAEEFSDFAKMPKSQEQVINLANKIEEICKLYENTENVSVDANLTNYKDAYIIADDRQMSRALINLIKNSIQAIPEGVKGEIKVDLDVFGKKAIVKIRDNGSGIADDIKDKLFIPSFTTKSSGMGLGLAMVKNIVDNAHGKISFSSEIGKGTVFIMEFPLYDFTEEKEV